MRLCLLAGLTAWACGCSSQPCHSVPEMNMLLAQAMLVQVDVYDATSARCNGSLVAAQAAPLKSETFVGGVPIRLDIPPGDRVIAMTTFSDAAGRQPSGSACTEAMLAGGKGACLSLSLVEIDGGACTSSNDSCPPGQYCGSSFSCLAGCKGDGDCTDAATPKCQPVRHQCVACLASSDCSGGQICSPGGACTAGCDATTPCTGGKTCCGGACVDLLSDTLNCNGCGMACTGGDTLCCNGQCANPSNSTLHCGMCGNACSTLNATPSCSAGVCGWTCTGNFIHCGSGNTGCDTPSDNVNSCGGCGNVCMPTNATANSCANAMTCSYTCQTGFLDCSKIGADTDGCETAQSITNCGACNAACDTAHSTGASCSSGVCSYTGCIAGYIDCNMTAPNSDGCECPTAMCCGTSCQPVHMNGLGQTYLDLCQALGTPGNAATYNVAMATAARAAWSAGTDASVTCTGNVSCLNRTGPTSCATWCYTKSLAGRVLEAPTCTCPLSTSPAWN